MDRSLFFLSRLKDGSLALNKSLDLPYVVDNVDWDSSRNELVMGSIMSPLEGLKKMEGHAAAVTKYFPKTFNFQTSKRKFQPDGY